MIDIVEKPIDLQKIIASVQDPAAGGIDVFIGTTRNNARDKKVIRLEYEVYFPMALAELKKIADDVRSRWQIVHISIVHRIGIVNVGEMSVVVAVSSVHRNEALEACRYTIDMLKKTVPIWKKECFDDGEVWVGLEGREQKQI
jgi:molybdopterin synthase catalytic subunit